MDWIQSAFDSVMSSSARLRATTVSTPSETVTLTVGEGVADDEAFGNQDQAYDDVDAQGRPAPPPQRGRTSTRSPDSVDGDDDDGDGNGDLDGDAPPPPRCKACRGWGHRTRSAHACPKNLSREKYTDHIQELIKRGEREATECLPWNEIYPENTQKKYEG